MADWEAEGYLTNLPIEMLMPTKWEGEDEDDEDIKDNWDDDDDEEEEQEEEGEEDKAAEKTQVINTEEMESERSLFDKTNEFKSKKKHEEEASQPGVDNLPSMNTVEEELAERLRVQKLQEEAELELVKEAFGVDACDRATGLDAMCPSSKDDFVEFEKLLKEKMAPLEKSVHYPNFLDSLFRELCISLDVEELKKISKSLSALLSEKQKLDKQRKGKTKKIKGVSTVGGLKAKMWDEMDGYDGGDTQDFDDFM